MKYPKYAGKPLDLLHRLEFEEWYEWFLKTLKAEKAVFEFVPPSIIKELEKTAYFLTTWYLFERQVNK